MKFPRWLRIGLPLVLSGAVLVWLFTGPLQLEDMSTSVQAVTAAQADGSVQVTLPGGTARRVPGDRVHSVSGGLVLVEPGLLTVVGGLPWWVPPVVIALLSLALVIQAIRLLVLLRTVGVSVSYRQCLRAQFIGLFYGNVIPAGQVGGDPLKAMAISRDTGCGVTESLTAVLVDRVIGLAVLAGIALLALASQGNDERFGDLRVWVGAGVGLAAVAFALLASRRLRRWTGTSWLAQRVGGGDRRLRSVTTLRSIGRSPRTLISAAAISLVVQGLMIAATAVVGEGLGLSGIDAVDYLALVPPAMVLASLPGSAPGGWGVGEGAFVLLFGAVGVPASEAFLLSAGPRLAMTALSLCGLPAAAGLQRGGGTRELSGAVRD